jgi:SAM-dependent methyltransferase
MAEQLFWVSATLLAALADSRLHPTSSVTCPFNLGDVSCDFPCAVCQHASQRHFEASGYWIRQCGSCGHQFAELSDASGHVQRQYGDKYFTGGGAGYSNYLQEERLLVHRGRWYARRVRRFCRSGSVCDVGAAAGFTLAGFREAGWEPFGIEPNAKMAEYARQRLNICVHATSLEEWQPNCAFDLVLMLQVLPHFVDPGRALQKAAQAVRPGGQLLIETWDRSSWTARLCGKGWHEYSPPSVLHWFSRAGLTQLAHQAGFAQVASGRPSKWINAGHAKSVLQHKAASSLTNRLAFGVARLIPDRVAIPYIAEDLFWALFRRAEGSSLTSA